MAGKRLRFIGDSMTRDFGLGFALFLQGLTAENATETKMDIVAPRYGKDADGYPVLKGPEEQPVLKVELNFKKPRRPESRGRRFTWRRTPLEKTTAASAATPHRKTLCWKRRSGGILLMNA